MTKNPREETHESDAAATTGERIEEKLVAFAEQLGTLVGTVQSKTEGWLDRSALAKEITRIRDGASELLSHVSPGQAAGKKAAPRASRGPVDAPGKRHRKPPPRERTDSKMGEARGKQAGRKSVRTGRRGGRG